MESLDLQLLVPMAGFVVALLFGKHLQTGFQQLRSRPGPAELPLRQR